MRDIIFSVRVGSPNSKVWLVKRTINSIRKCFSDVDYLILISLGDRVNEDVKLLIEDIAKNDSRVVIFERRECSWASFVNKAIDYAFNEKFKFFVKAHDDIEVLSEDFFPTLIDAVEACSREVGWVSFTDIGWRSGNVSYSTRPGWHLDSRSIRAECQLFQFNRFPDNWYKARLAPRLVHRLRETVLRKEVQYPKPTSSLRNYDADFPQTTCRVHAPFNNFVAISDTSLRKLGYCKDWNTKNALLVDEDWGLRASNLGMVNIWVPYLHYEHYMGGLEAGRSRSFQDISSDQKRVHKLFWDDWGFQASPTEREFDKIRKKYSFETMTWGMDLKSHEYVYDV